MFSDTALSWVGAITGIFGAVVGWIAYRRSNELKALDLRIELGKAHNILRSTVGGLIPLLDRAKQSHLNVASATGTLNSGGTEVWKRAWEEDMAQVRSLVSALAAIPDDYQNLSHQDLELGIVKAHDLQQKADLVQAQYDASLTKDAEDADFVREARLKSLR